MKNFNQDNRTAVSIIIAALFIALSIVFRHEVKLIVLPTIFNVLGSLSVVVAFAAYAYKKRQDLAVAAIDQISFFRKELIPLHNRLVELIDRDMPEYDLYESRIRLDEPTIMQVKKRREFKDAVKLQMRLMDNEEISEVQTDILNVLEELSWGILYLGTINHPAIVSIKTTFIESVEINAITLLSHREIFTGDPSYSGILKVYLEWENKVDRRSVDERAKKLLSELVTKEQI